MKWFASKKIDLDIVRSWIRVAIFQAKAYLRTLDPVTKVFRFMVILTCIYSVFLLNQIKDAQHTLVHNARLVEEWQATAAPKVAGVATASAKTATPTVTPSPTQEPTKDITPPSFTAIAGPQDGVTINSSNVCFPVKLYDETSSSPNLFVQYQFDSVWSGWTNNMSPCFQNLVNGTHTFAIEAKDQVGNISSLVTRTFTVQVN